MWSALHPRASSANHSPFRYTTRFLRKTPLRLMSRHLTASDAPAGFPTNCLAAAFAMPAESRGLETTWPIRGLASPCNTSPLGYVECFLLAVREARCNIDNPHGLRPAGGRRSF